MQFSELFLSLLFVLAIPQINLTASYPPNFLKHLRPHLPTKRTGNASPTCQSDPQIPPRYLPHLHLARLSTYPTFYSPPHVLSQKQRHNHQSDIAHNQSRQRREVSRRLSSKEDVGTSNISSSVKHEPHPIRNRPLRVASDISR